MRLPTANRRRIYEDESASAPADVRWLVDLMRSNVGIRTSAAVPTLIDRAVSIAGMTTQRSRRPPKAVLARREQSHLDLVPPQGRN